MNDFSPILFSLVPISTPDHESLIQKVRDALTETTFALDTGHMFEFGALVFINKHPDHDQVILEVQATSEYGRDQAIEILNKVTEGLVEGPLQWQDVTQEAIAYHTEQKNKEEEGQE